MLLTFPFLFHWRWFFHSFYISRFNLVNIHYLPYFLCSTLTLVQKLNPKWYPLGGNTFGLWGSLALRCLGHKVCSELVPMKTPITRSRTLARKQYRILKFRLVLARIRNLLGLLTFLVMFSLARQRTVGFAPFLATNNHFSLTLGLWKHYLLPFCGSFRPLFFWQFPQIFLTISFSWANGFAGTSVRDYLYLLNIPVRKQVGLRRKEDDLWLFRNFANA
jgi:hypothetical protein